MKSPKKHLKNYGFSIVEGLLGAAILGVVALGFSQLQKNASVTSRTFEASTEITTLVSEMRAILGNPKQCQETLAGNDPVGTSAGSISDMKILQNDGSFTSRFLSGSNVLHGQRKVKILEYSLSDSNPNVNVASENTTNLIIKFYRGKASINPDVTKLIKLHVEIDPTTLLIIKCRSLATSENSIWNREETTQANIFYAGGAVSIGQSGEDVNNQTPFTSWGPIFPSGGDIGTWDGAIIPRSWFGKCVVGMPCFDNAKGPYLHLSGYTNKKYGAQIHNPANGMRVISLNDILRIPGFLAFDDWGDWAV